MTKIENALIILEKIHQDLFILIESLGETKQSILFVY